MRLHSPQKLNVHRWRLDLVHSGCSFKRPLRPPDSRKQSWSLSFSRARTLYLSKLHRASEMPCLPRISLCLRPMREPSLHLAGLCWLDYFGRLPDLRLAEVPALLRVAEPPGSAPFLAEHVCVFLDQEGSIRCHDAVTNCQRHNLIHCLLIFSVKPNLRQQISDFPRLPKAER